MIRFLLTNSLLLSILILSSLQGFSQGANNYVTELASDGTNIYAGLTTRGDFTGTGNLIHQIGGICVDGIAKWDGTSWSGLGRGLRHEDDNFMAVRKIIVDGPNVYVAGRFTHAGEVAASNIAVWNGIEWSTIGTTGTNDEVRDMYLDGTDLYIVGRFTEVDGVPANNIAKWDGSNWSALGTGTDDRIYGITKIGSDIYVGGWFENAGGSPADYIAFWDGTDWNSLPSTVDERVFDITTDGTNLYVGGNLQNAGSISTNRIAKWDGTNWSALGSGFGGTSIINPIKLDFIGGELHAAGYFETAGGVTVNGIGKWDGINWSGFGSGVNTEAVEFGNIASFATLGSNLFVGGNFTEAGGVSSNYIAVWDGSSWGTIEHNLINGVYLFDYEALVALYNATDGPNWTNNTNWLSAEPVSNWFGVITTGNRVTDIRLPFNELSGTIPSEIGCLSELTRLDLYFNSLSGNLPVSISQFTKLNRIDVSNNNLDGYLIPELNTLTNVELLILDGNNFDGPLLDFDGLSSIKILGLGNNNLVGNLPEAWSGLSTLDEIRVDRNNLTGNLPTSYGSLDLLQLNLGNNNFSGSLPASYGNFTNLLGLHLQNLGLKGDISSILENFTSITQIFLEGNDFNGSIPSSFSNLDLQFFNISNNNFNSIPSLTNSTNLLFGDASNNRLDFEDIESNLALNNFSYAPQKEFGVSQEVFIFSGIPELLSAETVGGSQNTYQWFKDNNPINGATNQTYEITDPDPSDNGIYHLEVSSNLVNDLTLKSGDIHVQFSTLTNGVVQQDYEALVSLYNSTDGDNWTNNTNWLSSEPVSNWFGISVTGDRVTSINLNFNELSGSFPESLFELSALELIILSYNSLSGDIPNGFSNLSQLETLQLQSNQLTGPLPIELTQINTLEILYIWDNQLTGEIPPELALLENLELLFLGENQFTGTIPPELGQLSNLRQLALNDNQLSGVIPVELADLTQLTLLFLNNNLIGGEIPSEFGQLTNMQFLDLYFNFLGGSVPESLNGLTQMQRFRIDDNFFSFLPDFSSLPLLTEFNVANNFFDFGHLEPNRDITGFIYAPQYSIGETQDFLLDPGDNVEFSFDPVGGSSNVYRWQKDEVDIPGAESTTYAITSATNSDQATYVLKVTNSLLPDLEIVSYPVFVKVKQETYFEIVESGDVVEDNTTISYGGYWADVDNDGFEDLYINQYLTDPGVYSYFYSNNGDDSFTKVESGPISEIDMEGRYNSWGDYNNDGNVDLLFTQYDRDLGAISDEGIFVLKNNGSNNFERVKIYTSQPGTFGALGIWVDMNNDGWLDVVFSEMGDNDEGVYILYATGNGNFSTELVKIAAVSTSWVITHFDIDNDNDQDIIYNDKNNQGRVITNNNGSFSDGLLDEVLRARGGSNADIDNDGDFDIYLPEFIGDGLGMFFINDQGTFTKKTQFEVLGENFRARGATFGDIDNDGFVDLITFTGNSLDLFLNQQDGTFAKASNQTFLASPSLLFSGYSLSDYNNDGALDLIAANFSNLESNQQYQGIPGSNNWFNLKLNGSFSNASAIGARIVLESGALTMSRQIQGQTGFCSQNSLVAHFGLAQNTNVNKITIYWPSGNVQTLLNQTINQVLEVDEDCDTKDIFYADSDGDGYGDPNSTIEDCFVPEGYVTNSDDCDDTDANKGVLETFYEDADGDGLGNSEISQESCSQPTGYVSNADDCDDTDAEVGESITWYADADEDGFGDANTSETSCTQPVGFVADATDCDDADADVYPGAPAKADGKDNNCDGEIDRVNQSITFAEIDAQTDGAGPITLSASSSSSLPVSYEISGPATLDGNTLTITGAGLVTITATQGGDDNFAAAESKTINFCVNPQPVISLEGEGTSGLVLTSNYASGNQWLLNSTAESGAVNQTYNITGEGSYSLQVDIDGCVGTSETLEIIISDLENQLESEIATYPNPVQDLLNVNVRGYSSQEIELRVIDQQGKVVLLQKPDTGREVIQLEMGGLKTGMYLLQVEVENEVFIQKVYKQ